MSPRTVRWSDWIAFARPRGVFDDFQRLPGVYRVRPIGHDHLVYIGQTGRSLRERVRALCLRTLDPEIPFNDPHTAAPNLWAWRQTEGWDYVASVAEVDHSDADRQALECWLLWQYRLEKGESTLANHGRFHPQFTKSGSRKSGYRGERLPEGQSNPAGSLSLPPIRAIGQPTSGDWMGLEWSETVSLTRENLAHAPPTPGLYRIVQGGQVVYVGESGDLRERLRTHARNWNAPAIRSWFETSYRPSHTSATNWRTI